MPRRRKPLPPPSSLPHKLWRTLQIAGYPVKVYLTKDLHKIRGAEGETMPLGTIPGEMGPVYIEDSLVGTRAFDEVLMHELLHVAENCYGLDLEELHIRLLALGLHQLVAPVLRIDANDDADAAHEAKAKS